MVVIVSKFDIAELFSLFSLLFIHVCCCWFRCSGTGNQYSIRKETSCLPLLNAGFEPRVSDTKSPADWMPTDKPTELSGITLKTWTRQPVPMISEHSAHSTPLPVGSHTWLWHYCFRFCLYMDMLIYLYITHVYQYYVLSSSITPLFHRRSLVSFHLIILKCIQHGKGWGQARPGKYILRQTGPHTGSVSPINQSQIMVFRLPVFISKSAIDVARGE